MGGTHFSDRGELGQREWLVKMVVDILYYVSQRRSGRIAFRLPKSRLPYCIVPQEMDGERIGEGVCIQGRRGDHALLYLCLERQRNLLYQQIVSCLLTLNKFNSRT